MSVFRLLDAEDALRFKGSIDVSTNPDYPAADAGHQYRVIGSGKIGGASGLDASDGDIIACFVDDSAAGDQAAVGANWVRLGGASQADLNNLRRELRGDRTDWIVKSASLFTDSGLTPVSGDAYLMPANGPLADGFAPFSANDLVYWDTTTDPAAWSRLELRNGLEAYVQDADLELVYIEASAGWFSGRFVAGSPNIAVPAAGVGGTADAITLTIANGPELVDGLVFVFTPLAANAGAVTLAYNGGDALAVADSAGDPLTVSALSPTAPVSLAFDAAADLFRLVAGNGVGGAFRDGGVATAVSGVITLAAGALHVLTAGETVSGIAGLGVRESASFIAPATGDPIVFEEAGSPPSGLPLAFALSLTPGEHESIYTVTNTGAKIVLSGAGSAGAGPLPGPTFIGEFSDDASADAYITAEEITPIVGITHYKNTTDNAVLELTAIGSPNTWAVKTTGAASLSTIEVWEREVFNTTDLTLDNSSNPISIPIVSDASSTRWSSPTITIEIPDTQPGDILDIRGHVQVSNDTEEPGPRINIGAGAFFGKSNDPEVTAGLRRVNEIQATNIAPIWQPGSGANLDTVGSHHQNFFGSAIYDVDDRPVPPGDSIFLSVMVYCFSTAVPNNNTYTTLADRGEITVIRWRKVQKNFVSGEFDLSQLPTKTTHHTDDRLFGEDENGLPSQFDPDAYIADIVKTVGSALRSEIQSFVVGGSGRLRNFHKGSSNTQHIANGSSYTPLTDEFTFNVFDADSTFLIDFYFPELERTKLVEGNNLRLRAQIQYEDSSSNWQSLGDFRLYEDGSAYNVGRDKRDSKSFKVETGSGIINSGQIKLRTVGRYDGDADQLRSISHRVYVHEFAP